MRRGPYKLLKRATLTLDRISRELVAKLVEDALRPPKGGKARSSARWATLSEAEREAKIAELASILNMRRAEFYYAQEERGRADRRDRAKALVDELRALVPEIIRDAEDQVERFRGADPFSRASLQAAQRLRDWGNFSAEFLDSSMPALALPPVDLPANVFGWQWCGHVLLGDLRPLLGTNAAVRFIAAAIPLMTGERPTPASVARQLKSQKIAVASG